MPTDKDVKDLTDLELVALAGAVPEKRLTEAKRAIADGASLEVDFSVRITGNVQKGIGTPGGTTTTPGRVNLTSLQVFCQVLRKLHVGKRRLAELLMAVDVQVTADEELTKVFETVAAERSKDMPPTTSTTPGRAGSVRVTAEAKRA